MFTSFKGSLWSFWPPLLVLGSNFFYVWVPFCEPPRTRTLTHRCENASDAIHIPANGITLFHQSKEDSDMSRNNLICQQSVEKEDCKLVNKNRFALQILYKEGNEFNMFVRAQGPTVGPRPRPSFHKHQSCTTVHTKNNMMTLCCFLMCVNRNTIIVV